MNYALGRISLPAEAQSPAVSQSLSASNDVTSKVAKDIVAGTERKSKSKMQKYGLRGREYVAKCVLEAMRYLEHVHANTDVALGARSIVRLRGLLAHSDESDRTAAFTPPTFIG